MIINKIVDSWLETPLRYGFRLLKKIYPKISRRGKVYNLIEFKMWLDLREGYHSIKRRFRIYELEVSQYIEKNLSEGDTYVDIGACIGYHSLEASNIVGERGEVYSFEADPENFGILCLNKKLNSFNQMHPVNKAVYNEKEYFNFHNGEQSGWGSIVEEDTGMKVKADTFDNLRENLGIGNIDLIKIDTEGAEPEIVEGMKETLQELDKVKILIELHTGDFEIPGEIQNMIERYNMSCRKRSEEYLILEDKGGKINEGV